MSDMYSIARQLKAPGVATVATFNPARLTKALRNTVRSGILSGVHKGGWSSKSKEVRDLMFKLLYTMPEMYVVIESDYLTLHSRRRPISGSIQSELIGLLEADCTLQKMNYDTIYEGDRYRPPRSNYFETVDRRCRENIEIVKTTHIASHCMIVREPKLRQQMAAAFLTARTEDDIALAKTIASMLDENKEWNIPLDHNF